jgi:hypothetical protein
MNSCRKYLYATVLALTTLSFAPNLSSAQEPARGRFKLTHSVYWDGAVVPAGNYRFSVESNGQEMLRLDKISGSPAGFLFVVHDHEDSKPTDISRIVLDTTAKGSYVSSLQLPEYGMTLNFAVRGFKKGKQMANAETPASASAQ